MGSTSATYCPTRGICFLRRRSRLWDTASSTWTISRPARITITHLHPRSERLPFRIPHHTATSQHGGGRCTPSGPPEALMKARMVLVRKDGHVPPLTPLYNWPYLVLQRAQKVFRLKIGNREDTVSVHRLKPACTAEDVQPAQPPRRGRPPRAPPDLVPPPPPQPHTRAPILSPLKRVAFKEIPDIITEGRPVRLKRPPQRYRS
jgi:hypothetical protein